MSRAEVREGKKDREGASEEEIEIPRGLHEQTTARQQRWRWK